LDGLELPGHRLPGVRAELLHRAGRAAEAREQLELALTLVDNVAERRHLSARLNSW
jgi:predicted RNA polymerase sigma factor